MDAQRSGAETVLCPCYSIFQTFLPDITMLITLLITGQSPWSRRHCPFCYEAILCDLIGAFVAAFVSVSAWRNSRRDYNH